MFLLSMHILNKYLTVELRTLHIVWEEVTNNPRISYYLAFSLYFERATPSAPPFPVRV